MTTTQHNNIEVPEDGTLKDKTATLGSYGSSSDYRIEFDLETGTIDINFTGAMAHSYTDLSIYDFVLRFYSDLPDAHQRFSRQVLNTHIDTFKDNVRLHRFNADAQKFRTTWDDARMTIRDYIADMDDTETPDDIDQFEQDVFQELLYEVTDKQILNNSLESLEQDMTDCLENNGLDTVIEEFSFRDLRREFMKQQSIAHAEHIDVAVESVLIDYEG